MKYSDNKDYKVIAFVMACIHIDATESRVKMVAQKCREHNCRVIFYSTQTDFKEDIHSEQIGNRETAIFDIIEVERFDAIVLMSESFKEHELKERFVKRALEANVPVIAVESHMDGCINVAFDYKTPFRDIVKHMVEYHGYRKINYMSGNKGISFAEDRLQIYKEVLEENGIPYDERRVYYGDFWELPTIAAMDKMFEDWEEMPEAIICANDVMAITVCDCLKKRGYKIPKDIAVSGFDGVETEKYHYPRLLTSGNNKSMFIEGMFKIINEPGLKVEEKDVLIPAYNDIQIGGSCGCKAMETVNAAEEMVKLKSDMQEQMIYQSRLGRTIVSSGNNREQGMVESIIPKHLGVLNYYDFWFVAKHRLLTESYLTVDSDENTKNIIHYDNNKDGVKVEYISGMDKYEIIPNFYEYLESDQPLLVMSVQNPEDEFGYAVIRFDKDKFKCLSYAGFLSHFRYLLEMIRIRKIAMDVYRNDVLTGIMNRTGFYERFEQVMRNNNVEHLTVISIDLYKFKYINDTFGHAEGDVALKNVGRIIRECMQKGEIAARVGGDEFIILLYKDNQEIRRDIILFMLEKKTEEFNKKNTKDYKMIFSIGTYTGEIKDKTLDHFLKEADIRMYKHKSEQRKENTIQTKEYIYKNAPIPGGGYVTGLMYHKKQPGILYARTDIGGTYRFDYAEKKWHSLINHVTAKDLSETYPTALALDDNYPERLYIISGVTENGYGVFSISEDYGQTFTYKKVPTVVHGNMSGRGTGYRLVVDKNDSNVLYFASQKGGLLKTSDRGDTWTRLPIEEDYMTFVWVSDDSKTIVAGTAGYTTRVDDSLRGHSLYVSYDGGESFEKLMQPDNVWVNDSKMNGLVASRYDYDGKYLYVTMQSTGRWNYIVDLGYSCDTGDTIGGKVLRYYFEDGKIAGFDDITPDEEGNHTVEYLNYGFGGVCSCTSKPGLLVCSTLCKEKETAECIYISEDYGDTWRLSLRGLAEGNMYFRTSYMEPKYNANVSIVHWISDVKINPFNANELWFNSGTGVFTTNELLSDNPKYHDYCDGIEETVHLNVYGPVKGDVKLVDIVGDLGGFAFRELDKPCTNSFDDAEGNRYITCINADLSDTDGNLAVITARGNWKGKTKGGLIRTKDGFKTFERIPMPFYLGGRIKEQLETIERPNVNAGWVAMSSNGENIVWSVAKGIRLPIDMVIVSNDAGATFNCVQVYKVDGTKKDTGYFKVFSDRCKDEYFYGFDEEGRIYLSKDKGVTFCEKEVCALDMTGMKLDIPKNDFGYIDTANKTEIRGVAGKIGVFYLALAENGLWKLIYNESRDAFDIHRCTADGDSCFRVGLGVGRVNGDYVKEDKAIYLSGIIGGEYGFYRTLDEGKSYTRINNNNQMFGDINSIDGDKHVFGRFFLATGSRGVLYGEEK